jgi:hypothetical protein
MMVTSPTVEPPTVSDKTAQPRLSAERCRSLLAGARGGHLALSQGALPLVVPVTCALDGEDLLVRAGLGLIGKVPAQPGVVAFQTDWSSPDGSSRWEILVQGRAEVLDERGPDARDKLPPPLPMVDQSMTAALRISMELFTGRQYGSAAGQSKETVE